MGEISEILTNVKACDDVLLKAQVYRNKQELWDNWDNIHDLMWYLYKVEIDVDLIYVCLCDIVEYAMAYCEHNRCDDDIKAARNMFEALIRYNANPTKDNNILRRNELNKIRTLINARATEFNNRNKCLLIGINTISSISINNRQALKPLYFKILASVYDAIGGKHNQGGQQDIRNIIRKHFPVAPEPLVL